jgi:DNA mismatch repair ATPase MutS
MIHEVLRTSSFLSYYSPCNEKMAIEDRKPDKGRKMILDSMTLTNLEIISNSSGSDYGSLIKRLDTCSSPGGKRRLRDIVVAPYSNTEVIKEKQNLIQG